MTDTFFFRELRKAERTAHPSASHSLRTTKASTSPQGFLKSWCAASHFHAELSRSSAGDCSLSRRPPHEDRNSACPGVAGDGLLQRFSTIPLVNDKSLFEAMQGFPVAPANIPAHIITQASRHPVAVTVDRRKGLCHEVLPDSTFDRHPVAAGCGEHRILSR